MNQPDLLINTYYRMSKANLFTNPKEYVKGEK